MKPGLFAASVVAAFAFASGSAVAGQYECKVYCTGPSGAITVGVKANSSSEAASIVDKGADKMCKSAGYKAATSATMSSSQCR